MKLAVHLFALILLWCPSTAWAEPVSEYETKKAKTDKRKARGRSAKQEASGKTNGNGPRPKSPPPRSTGTCKLKVKPPGWRMKIDPEIESLFDRQMVIDGAFYPYYRGDLEKCCDDGDGGCLPQEDALAQTGCYAKTSPKDYREVTEKMGINVGAGPYRDDMLSIMRARQKEGRNVHVILKSNDLDTARRKNHFGNVLYIQTWDESHYDLSPLALARRLYRLGARIVQPAYNASTNRELPTWYAGGADQDGVGLSVQGETLVNLLLEQYILLDVSHVGTASALQIIEMAKTLNRPVTANHANAIGVYDDRRRNEQCLGGCKSRNHTDEVICAIARGGGTIGVTPVRFMFAPTFDETYYAASENDFLRHLDYVAKALTCKDGRRNIDMTHHVSLGSDTSMNGYDKRLKWLHMRMANRYNRWKRIASRLKNECSYTLTEITRIIGGNLQRVYRAALPGIMRPVTTLPRANSTLTGKTVKFRWNLPTVNTPKWQPKMETKLRVPKRFSLHLQIKRRGKWRDFKTVKVKRKTVHTLTLGPGQYRWFVKAKSGGVMVNSLWSRFTRR